MAAQCHAAKPTLTIADLIDEPMIGSNDGSNVGIGRITTDLVAEPSVLFHVDLLVSSATSLLGLAAAGLGWGFVPDSLARVAVSSVAFRAIDGDVRKPLWAI